MTCPIYAHLRGEMDPKSEALAAAKQRIITLQEHMSNRILQIAAEVEKLMEVATERETREWARARREQPRLGRGTERLSVTEPLYPRSSPVAESRGRRRLRGGVPRMSILLAFPTMLLRRSKRRNQISNPL